MSIEDSDLGEWVGEAEDESSREFREAVHTILSAIASDANLRVSMILKGGILLAIRYHSHRFTKDIDLSTEKTLGEDFTEEKLVSDLNASLSMMVETLGYGLDCGVQSSKIQPNTVGATYPSIKMNVGYAYKGSQKHKKLLAKQSPSIVSIDYSLNEPTPNVDTLRLAQGEELKVYSLIDLIAEKYRALLQQVERNRNRRQDVFDLFLILGRFHDLDEVEKGKILTCLIDKSRARGLEPNKNSMDHPDVRARAGYEYESLADEIGGELPDFEESFSLVLRFYKSLPWH